MKVILAYPAPKWPTSVLPDGEGIEESPAIIDEFMKIYPE
jgi:hypothetical protein